jgi:hypothetical protein
MGAIKYGLIVIGSKLSRTSPATATHRHCKVCESLM